MDYRPYVASSTIDLVVNDHIVTCGSTTWQIRNIAATVVDRIVIPFNEPEPCFNTAEPGLRVPWRGLAIGAFLLWAAVHFGLNFPRLAIFAAMAVGVAACFMAVRDLRRRKADWAAEKQRIAGHWVIWDEMRRDPPVFFRLMLETNAGSKPLFYALEEQQILRANEALKAAMEKQSAGDVNLSIQALNVGSPDAINNFGSSIFNQSIQRG